MITYLKTYVGFLKLGLSRLDADVISYVAYCKDGCYQTNQQIADGVVSTANRIRVVISNLVNNGWLASEIKNGNARTLRVTDKSLQIIYSESEKNTPIKNDHPMIINDHPSRSDMITPVIKNDHPHDHLRSGGMIINDHPSSYINNNINNNLNKKDIMSSAAGEKSAMPTAATHTPPSQTDFSSEKNHSAKQKKQNKNQRSQIPNVPDAETIAEEFIRNRPNLTRDVAVTEATKFRNYYLSHPNKCPENNFWNGLIGNWLMNDRDKLFAKNSLGESEQEPYYKRKYGQVDHAAMADWLFGK